MSKRTAKEMAPFLYALQNMGSPAEQALLTSRLDDRSFKQVCDCINKVVNLPDSLNLESNTKSYLRKVLKPQQKDWLYLASPKGNLRRKRGIIAKQTGGAFALPMIIASVLPAAIEAISSLFKK